MALVKGTNSFATVAEADAYFADILDSASWSSADSTRKAQALVSATGFLNEMSWSGTAISESQLLAFPRVTEYFDTRLGAMIYLDGSTIPDRIIKATYELAKHLLSNEDLLGSSTTVDNIVVGPISLTNIRKPSTLPFGIKTIVNPLLINGGSRVWWRAN